MSTPVIIAGPRNGITVEKIEAEIRKSPLKRENRGLSFSGKSKIIIEGYDFRVNREDNKQLAVTDCQDVVIRRCIFGNKNTLGQGLNITGSKTKRITVEYCIFENMTYKKTNGGEPMRIGLSEHSGISFNVTVRNCIFRNLRSDPECISIKTCNNIVEDSFFINNKSNVTVRHGGYNTIQHNLFRGSGGIRLHGYGNEVPYNCFEGNKETESYAPIVVRYGTQPKDPNFKDVKTPSEKSGKGHVVYAQTVDNEIEGNEFKGCTKQVIALSKGGFLKPINTKNENNNIVDKFTFELPPPVEPPVPEPPTPPEPPIPPVPEPPIPPEPPVEEEDDEQDQFGVKKIYADSETPQYKAMDMDDPDKDDFLNKEERANMKKEPDGSWSLDGKDTGKYQVRLGIWMNPPLTDVEGTIYAYHISDVKGMEGESRYSYQFYRGGGDHSTSNNGCEGAAYKSRIQENKDVVICKELRHPVYSSNLGGIKDLTKSPIGNWIGVKFITYNLPKMMNGRTPVMTQVFCDESGMDQNGNFDPKRQNWVKYAEVVDKGGWSAGDGGGCPPLEIGNSGKRKSDEILNLPGGRLDKGNVFTYRTDGAKTKIKYFSIRAIKPDTSDTS